MMVRHRYDSKVGSGIAALEVTLLLPLIILFMALAAEYGKAYYDYITLTKLQRSAVRYLANHIQPGPDQLPDLSADNAQPHITKAKKLIIYGALVEGEQKLLDLNESDIVFNALENNHIQVTSQLAFVPIFGNLLPSIAAMFSPDTNVLKISIRSSSTIKLL